MSLAVSVENVSKKYVLRHATQARYATLREAIPNALRSVGQRFRRRLETEATREEFWALRDINFEVRQGDRVGIVGRNGAGKSTLLKLLSRITEPSSGRITLTGRVASLLEVGTGFNPELTGRENIYLNGAILGMPRCDIARKFDEIVAFAEVEKFLDTPVKRYSSGMYMRLAFAVAAHLEPDILVVDEVLAVGDQKFQEKCLSKMRSVGAEGRTVLFVSHNLSAIAQMCNSALVLNAGNVVYRSNDVAAAIRHYLDLGATAGGALEWVADVDGGEYGNESFAPLRMYVSGSSGEPVSAASPDDELWFHVEGSVARRDSALQIGYAIYADDGTLLYWSCHTDIEKAKWPVFDEGSVHLKSRLPRALLNEGSFRIELIAALYFREWICQPTINAPSLHLDLRGKLSSSPYWTTRRPGLLAPTFEWSLG